MRKQNRPLTPGEERLRLLHKVDQASALLDDLVPPALMKLALIMTRTRYAFENTGQAMRGFAKVHDNHDETP